MNTAGLSGIHIPHKAVEDQARVFWIIRQKEQSSEIDSPDSTKDNRSRHVVK